MALRAHFGDTDPAVNRRYFEWKFEANPFLDGPVFAVACLGDEVVGMRGLYATPWTNAVTGEAFVLPHADDLIVHPEHRGRGLFVPIMESLLRQAADLEFGHVLSLSGGESTQALSLATGWRSLGDVERVVRPGARRSLLGRVRRRWSRLVGGRKPDSTSLPGERRIDRVVARMVASDRRVVPAPGASLEGIDEPPSGVAVRAARTMDYMRWRLGNPARRYRILRWEGVDARGAAVLAWSGPDAHSLSVVELLASDDEAFRGLMGAVCSPPELEVRALGRSLSSERRAALLDLGFVSFSEALVSEQRRRFLIADTGFAGTPLPGGAAHDGSLWRYALLETMQV